MSILLFTVACRKNTEIDKIIYKEFSEIVEFNYAKDSNHLSIPFIPKLLVQNDTIVKKDFDIDADKINDFQAVIVRYNIDTTIVVKQYIRRLNQNLELLGNQMYFGRTFIPFKDTNNYIAPSTELWSLTDSDSDHILVIYHYRKCKIAGAPNFCFTEKIGYFMDQSRYFIGFRIKNKSSSGMRLHWNYGYVKINIRELDLWIRKIAYENKIDKPILLRE